MSEKKVKKINEAGSKIKEKERSFVERLEVTELSVPMIRVVNFLHPSCIFVGNFFPPVVCADRRSISSCLLA